MKTLTAIFFSLFSLPVVVAAQTADEMLYKTAAAIESNQQGQAVSYFRQAVKLKIERSEMFYWTNVDKSNAIALKLAYELAEGYKKNRNYDKAYLFYRELLQKQPDHIDYLVSCAEMQVGRGHEKEAVGIYEQILQLDGDNLAANIFLGNYYYLMAEKEKEQLENDYKKLSAPTKMQYANYRDKMSQLFSNAYRRARVSLQKFVSKFPSTEARRTLDKISIVEKEVNR